MYSLKPILVDQNIDLPPCMYKLKPVNNENSENMQESINNSVSSSFTMKIFLMTTTSLAL